MVSEVALPSNVFNPKELTIWSDLKADFLTEGSGLRVIDPKDSKYAIVRYDRKTPEVNGWLRSVVFDKETCKPVCVAPPKSVGFTNSFETCTVQEFVDGTMMNLFWMPDEEGPHVVTRSSIGAANKFYSDMSFVDMLMDALKAHNGDMNFLKPYAEAGAPQFISIVLQHPKNRVVSHVSEPRITVVHTGFVTTISGTVVISEDPAGWSENLQQFKPVEYDIHDLRLASPCAAGETDNMSYDDLVSYVDSFSLQPIHHVTLWQGIVLKNGLGLRCGVRNKTYSQVRSLRGNESDTAMRFCRLRLSRVTKRYLQYYPEDEKVFYELEGKLRQVTRHLLDLYARTFKFKKEEFHTLSWPYKHHVSVIHNEFKEKLKPVGKSVDIEFMIDYVNSLSVEDMSNLFKKPAAPKPKVVSL